MSNNKILIANTEPLPRLCAVPSDGLVFVSLGGVGEIGMNLSVYGCDGRLLVVDMGVTFGDDVIPGVDVVMPDPTFLEDNVAAIDGLVLTHAHEDHIGAVAYLWPELRCPVYATPFAAQFLRHKLREEGYEREETRLVETPLGGRVSVGPFDVEYVSLSHSIPESNALFIRTRHGNVYHSGDWKIDPEPLVGQVSDMSRIGELGDEGVLAAISDSTNILSRGHSGSEGDVRRSLQGVFGGYQGKIAVSCFASNVARLETLIAVGRAHGRQIVLCGRSLWRIVDVARYAGYLQDVGPLLEARDARGIPDGEILYICTGSQGEPRAALNRIAHGDHRDVSLGAGDVCIFSSRVIPGNEKAIFRLQNQLIRAGVEIITDRDAPIHVSGHPGQEEVAELYKLLRPPTVVPVHGERRHLQVNADFAVAHGAAHAVVLEDGHMLALSAAGPQVLGEVTTGRLALAGDRIVPLQSPPLRERKRLAENGAVVATVVMNRRGQLTTAPVVTVYGLVAPDDEEEAAARSLSDVVEQAVSSLEHRQRQSDGKVKDVVRRAISRAISPHRERRPVAGVHLVRV